MLVAQVDTVLTDIFEPDEQADALSAKWTEREVENYIGEDEQREYPEKKIRFRLLDDDGIKYFGGWLRNDGFCDVQETVLSWGTWYAGCTTIEVRVDGEWQQEIG